jgi:ribosomal protein S18 acetylase RimI-like enzyme
MSAITKSFLSETPQLRPLNVMRDLPRVADLVETCFSATMDADGQRFIQQMRRAGKDNRFLHWAANAVESTSMPLSGFVWEESGSLVGNVSLIPYRFKGRKIYLIANVAVHPDQRRMGIARQLTEIALEHTRKRKADATWLQVRDDNPGAIQLYKGLGFREQARRTKWQAAPDKNMPDGFREFEIKKRSASQWPLQKEWMQRLYPDKLSWYQPIPWIRFRPGLLPAVYRFFIESETRTWTISNDSGLVAAISWLAGLSRTGHLWAALPEQTEPRALTTLLLYVRRVLAGHETLALDLPGGEAVDAIQDAGFNAQRTLVWMRADTTFGADLRK